MKNSVNYWKFFKNKISFYLKTKLETYFKEKAEKKKIIENYKKINEFIY